jgi:hypothetical protein
MSEMKIDVVITEPFVSAWKKITHSHWWGGGLTRVPLYGEDMLPLTWAEKEALAKMLIQLQPQVNAFRDAMRGKSND